MTSYRTWIQIAGRVFGTQRRTGFVGFSCSAHCTLCKVNTRYFWLYQKLQLCRKRLELLWELWLLPAAFCFLYLLIFQMQLPSDTLRAKQKRDPGRTGLRGPEFLLSLRLQYSRHDLASSIITKTKEKKSNLQLWISEKSLNFHFQGRGFKSRSLHFFTEEICFRKICC